MKSFINLQDMITYYSAKRNSMTPVGSKGDEMRHVATLIEKEKSCVKGISCRYE